MQVDDLLEDSDDDLELPGGSGESCELQEATWEELEPTCPRIPEEALEVAVALSFAKKALPSALVRKFCFTER